MSLEADLIEPRRPQLEEGTCCWVQVQRSAVSSAESLLYIWSYSAEMGMCINRNCNRLVLSALNLGVQDEHFFCVTLDIILKNTLLLPPKTPKPRRIIPI